MSQVDTSMSQLPAYELHRDARRRRNQATAAFSYRVVSKLAAWLRTAAKLARDWAVERRLRREMRMLLKFGDRELADIGVSRGEIEHLVRRGRR